MISNGLLFFRNRIAMLLTKVWIVVFLLVNCINIVIGQEKINLNNVKFREETLGSNLSKLAEFYRGKTKSSTKSMSGCYDAYLTVSSQFDEIEPMCYGDIGVNDLNLVINRLEKIIRERDDVRRCFMEDFQEQKKELEGLRKKKFPTQTPINLEGTGGSEAKSDKWYGEPIYLILYILLIFILIALIKSSQKTMIRHIKWHLIENFRKFGRHILIPIYGILIEICRRIRNILIRPSTDTSKNTDNNAEVEAERLERIDKAANKEKERLANIEATNKEKERLADIEAANKEVKRLADIEAANKEVKRLADIEVERLAKKEASDMKEAKRLEKLKPFFMPVPSGECLFFDSNRFSNYYAGRTMYKFFPKNEREAEFEFYEEASGFAIDKPQTHIEPACEPINARDNSAIGIRTKRKGIAYLETDGTWRVKPKAQIEYLY